MNILKHLENLKIRFEGLERDLSNPDSIRDPGKFREMQRDHSRLSPVVVKFERYKKLLSERTELQTLIDGTDVEMRDLAYTELPGVKSSIDVLEQELRVALLPQDPNEDRNVILEIRAGAGGDEAGLFAGDLLRMYTRYAEKFRWRMEPLESSISERGGIKEVIMEMSGPGVWSQMKYESGVHRVQRVPSTEASGRIHTSTATVAVLPEAEEVDIRIDPSDLRIDTFRASGAGGQHINKTDSAVRITYIPTGLAIACQEERSQIKNRAKAMKLLRSRLLEQIQEKQAKEIAQNRRSQVGTGDRSEKIRTYNFPQDRITDHRINFSVHDLPSVMEGKLEDLIEALRAHEQAQQLQDLSEAAEGSGAS